MIRSWMKLAVLGLIGLAILAPETQAEDLLILKNGKRIRAQKVVYKRSSDEYVATIGAATSPYPADQVASVRVTRPSALRTAEQKLRTGDTLSAITLLKQIEQRYYRLNWDVAAKAMLAEAYFNSGDTAKAVRICDALFELPNVKLPGAVNRQYLSAVAESGDMDKVQERAVKMISVGSREASAAAQLMLADILFENGKVQEALIKGYLRTAELFRDVKDVQAEAVYGVYRCYRELGKPGRAKTYKKRLLDRHGESSFAEKAKLEG